MRTWDYRGVPIEPVLALLQQIFYSEIRDAHVKTLINCPFLVFFTLSMVLPAPFFSMCPMILIQHALCCLNPREHFTYPKRSSKCYEKFLETRKVKQQSLTEG